MRLIQISDNYKKIICDEIRFVINKINESQQYEEKAYYLSGIHNMIWRINNLDFDKHLIFIHFALSHLHREVVNSIEIRKQGIPPIRINEEFFKKLIKVLEKLANAIEENNKTYEILENISLLIYSLTGNGYYLQQKGIKVIDF